MASFQSKSAQASVGVTEATQKDEWYRGGGRPYNFYFIFLAIWLVLALKWKFFHVIIWLYV